MLGTWSAKIRQNGLLWCFNRIARELWHPHFSFVQPIATFTRKLFLPFSILGRSIDRAQAAKTGFSDDHIYLFYDFEVSPVTFDFCWTLALAEYERIQQGLRGVHVIFVPGKNNGLRSEDPEYELVVSHHSRVWRIHNLLLPAITLLPSFTGISLCSSRKEAAFIKSQVKHSSPSQYSVSIPNYHTLNERLNEQVDLRLLSANQQSLAYISQWLDTFLDNRKLISITMRQYNYMTNRNNKMGEWLRFIQNLDQTKYAVVLIPDTELASPNPSTHIDNQCIRFIPASWNVTLRMALYEKCFLNLGVNTGPMVLCWLNKKCNYITFKLQAPNSPQTSNSTMHWLGFKLNESLPFASENQKWVWEEDTFEVISREFQLMEKILEQSNIS